MGQVIQPTLSKHSRK